MICATSSRLLISLILVFCVIWPAFSAFHLNATVSQSASGDENWGYVTVRPQAHMFWWLYHTTSSTGYSKAPLILWLQGGPGGSGTGFGNFGEIGPLDVSLQPRNTTWLSVASLLFIDNPVGAGFSYVETDDAFTTDVHMIAKDLLTTFSAFLLANKELQAVPFYIFSESYGGKMTAAFSQVLWEAVKSKKVACNFHGFAMGDSWISPVDSTYSWGPYLYVNSLVDRTQLFQLNDTAKKVADLAASGKWKESTSEWSALEDLVEKSTAGVNFYNIQQWGGDGPSKVASSDGSTLWERTYQRHVGVYQAPDLAALMNGPIRKKLKVIPDSVQWGAQSEKVFEYQAEDFMKPVVDIVDTLIMNTSLSVVVYSGQLDLIVDTLGTEAWVYRLSNTDRFRAAEKEPIKIDGIPQAFVKRADNFQFFWILAAGHMVPADNGPAGLEMVKRIIHQ